MSKKSICKNCGDPIGDDTNSNEFWPMRDRISIGTQQKMRSEVE
jgi:hypothetical protein